MTFLLDVNVLMALLWETMNIIKSRVYGFAAPRISQRVRYRSLVSHGFLPIHLSATACRPIRRSAFYEHFLLMRGSLLPVSNSWDCAAIDNELTTGN